MIYDLIIIGGGPAGITAGIYATRQRLNTLLITKDFGGQMARKTVAIENYPGFEEISGQELIQNFTRHLLKQKIDIERDEVIKLKKVSEKFIALTKSKNQFEAKAVIVASGADPRPLEVPGEKKYIGRGLSYCTICDGPLFQDKTVAIIGGGNAGFEAAIYLSKIAKKIYILEAGSQIRADQENQERVNKTGKVEIIADALLKKIQGNQFVNSILYQDYNPPTALQEPIPTHLKKETSLTFQPRTKKLAVEGVFVEIGNQPATSFAKDLVDFNERDEIKVEFETCQTKTPGLFAAGDVNVGKFKQIITACSEGAKAALAVYQYLQKL